MADGIRTTLHQAALWMEGELRGDDREFTGVSSDSRRFEPGMLFFALRGENFDGHEFVGTAVAQGAAAAVVERPLDLPLPQIVVSDARRALGRLAAGWRTALKPVVVAVTGSNGKTTTKELLAAVLASGGEGIATRGNLNNDIGVPLTLLRLEQRHRWAVIEMGANHPGEIAYLTSLARPDVAVLTNAGPAHLAGFGSVEGVARAKGEIFRGLPENGTAIVNADAPFASLWRELAAPHRVLSFGLENGDVRGEWTGELSGGALAVHSPQGDFQCRLSLVGRHNAMNALAAAAAALAAGIAPAQVAAGLASVLPVHGRLEIRAGLNGARLIDDTYNANPASLRAGMEVLAGAAGRRILALGDMAELGDSAAQWHGEAGRTARTLGIDALYAVGELSAHAVAAFGEGAFHFPDQAALVAALSRELGPEVTVLVKGSRSRRMEKVVEALAAGGID